MPVQENIGMKKLNLAWNGFGEEGAIALAVALKFCTLVRLDLTNNRIGTEGFGCLIKSLRDNEYLKELIVSIETSHKTQRWTKTVLYHLCLSLCFVG